MLEKLPLLAADPILGLTAAYNADPNDYKVDLGVGVYKDEKGRTPIMAAVKTAQDLWATQEESKVYAPAAGFSGYNEGVIKLLLGESHPAVSAGRVVSVQAPGGCGALRISAEMTNRIYDGATLWVSTPTWANHIPLMTSAGLQLKEYPYYDYKTHGIDFDAMTASLEQLSKGDVVLLHACCHNPSGADLSQEQWRIVADILNKKGAIPFVDIAYQGLGDGLDEDAYGLRYVAEHCPEVIVASSCSKNFGLYRERVGAAVVIASTPDVAQACGSQLKNIAREIYSMPPSHGAALVDLILHDDALKSQWQTELDEMRERINGLRKALVEKLTLAGAGDRFDFIQNEKGMFSFLGITPEQVARLKEESSIYFVNSSRINIAGISHKNLDHIVESLIKVL